MQLLLGTSNPAKLARYGTILAEVAGECPEFALQVCSPREVGCAIEVVEDGHSARDNARKKAVDYARATNLPTLSVDEALHIAGLADEDQPGPYVRRFRGEHRTDEELLAAFIALIQRLSLSERAATWTFALCLALPRGAIYERQAHIPTILTDVAQRPLMPGYPLRSLSVDPATGKPLSELSPEEERARLESVYTGVRSLLSAALPHLASV